MKFNSFILICSSKNINIGGNPIKIAEGVEMLELSMKLGGRESTIFPTLIWDDNHMILVDAGLPGELKKIQDEISKPGLILIKSTK